MSANMNEISEVLRTGLSLTEPPVQITYLQEEPVGLAEYAGEVPSGCTYWGAGVEKAFYARLADHFNCEIGAFVMGVQPEGELKERLFGTIGKMEDEGYLAKGEANSIPHLKAAPPFVCYGPLGSLPFRPDVVVMFVAPDAAMLGLEGASFGKAHPFPVPVTGRPACSIIPYILQEVQPVAVSFGCTGFRTYVDNAKGKVLMAVRGDSIEEFSNSIVKIASANRLVSEENIERRRRIEV